MPNVKRSYSFYKVWIFLLKMISIKTTPIMYYKRNLFLFRICLHNFGQHICQLIKGIPPVAFLIICTIVWHCNNYTRILLWKRHYLMIPQFAMIRPPMNKKQVTFWLPIIFWSCYFNFNLTFFWLFPC